MSNFTSKSKISGLQSTQGGKGWYNPMTITLGATKGTGDLTDYYVAFYNSPTLLTSIVDTSATPIPVAALTGLAANDYFVLKYTHTATTDNWYTWDPQQTGTNKWVDISSETSRGHDICSAACSPATLLYTAYPVSAASWKIRLDKNFGSKTMYTAGYVTDSNNLSAFNDNITPTYP